MFAINKIRVDYTVGSIICKYILNTIIDANKSLMVAWCIFFFSI